MTSDSRDYFRGERALRFEGWAGTPVTWTLVLVHSILWLVYAGTVNRIAPGGTLHWIFEEVLSLCGENVVERGRAWQVLTYLFIHPPGNILGLGGLVYSLAFLFFLGRPLERILGSRRFLGLYVAGGVFAGVLAVPWVYLVGWSDLPVATASASVYAISVGLALREPHATSFFGVPLWGVVLFLLLLHTALALATPAGEVFSLFPLVGSAFAWVHHRGADRWERFWSGLSERRTSRRAARASAAEDAERQRLDALLAKIQTEGIAALSPREKDFLQEASKKFR
jgi:membrane associated rhomboid family serine protease